ncbi:MAG: hypothetical protein ABSA83_18445 [Verrucomicrobiota bacterium]
MPKDGAMRSDGSIRHFAIAFAIAVVVYFAGFGWIQHRRVFKGPWEITFATDAAGRPSLLISEPVLKISQKIAFPDRKIASANLAREQRFDEAVTNLPFGEMIFQDPTFLPGTVTMRQFGHEIELLPRVLIIDKKEIPWRAGQTIEVH